MDEVKPKYQGVTHICADCGERIGFSTYNYRGMRDTEGRTWGEYIHYNRKLCAANRRRNKRKVVGG